MDSLALTDPSSSPPSSYFPSRPHPAARSARAASIARVAAMAVVLRPMSASTVTVRSWSRRLMMAGCHTTSTSATCLSGTDLPVAAENTLRLSIFPMSWRSAATLRSVTGMTLSSSRYSVVTSPLNAVCRERATSWLDTPARRARGWLMLTRIFLDRGPQSLRTFSMPAVPDTTSLASATKSQRRSGSRDETRTSTGAFTGEPSCRGCTLGTMSG